MARERGSSLMNVYVDHSSFLGPKVPDEVKRMVPLLNKLDRSLLRNLLQVAVRDLEGLNIPEKTFPSLASDDITEERLCILYSGILVLLKFAFRFPQASLKKEAFQAELQEIKIPEEFIEDLSSIVFGPKYESIEKAQLQTRIRLPTIESLRWRVDVAISTRFNLMISGSTKMPHQEVMDHVEIRNKLNQGDSVVSEYWKQ